MHEITVTKKDALVPTSHEKIFIITERGADCDAQSERPPFNLCGNDSVFYFDYGGNGLDVQLCTRHAKPTARGMRWVVDWPALIKQSRKVRRN